MRMPAMIAAVALLIPGTAFAQTGVDRPTVMDRVRTESNAGAADRAASESRRAGSLAQRNARAARSVTPQTSATFRDTATAGSTSDRINPSSAPVAAPTEPRP